MLAPASGYGTPRNAAATGNHVMDCYAHTGIPAAAICRGCGKGVCRRCAIEVPFGVVCSAACEPFARSLVELQQQSIKGIGNIRATRFIQPAVAVLFIGYGAFLAADQSLRPIAVFAVCTGVAVLGAWIWGQRKARGPSDP
jgi:hypothetical protein